MYPRVCGRTRPTGRLLLVLRRIWVSCTPFRRQNGTSWCLHQKLCTIIMVTRKQSRFTYKLGFRFTLSRPASESERPQQQRTTLSAHRTQDQDSCRNGRELSAIQIQRLVRGWQARVWAVQVVHDRAWRALVLIQANWRGALVRRHIHQKPSPARIDSTHRRSYKAMTNSSNRVDKVSADKPSWYHGCSERIAWEKSWAAVRLGYPMFRDRVRVWQAILELKRLGDHGGIRITNSEAWTALHDSCGNTSAAATLLSNEEYLLGKRLQEQVVAIPSSLLGLEHRTPDPNFSSRNPGYPPETTNSRERQVPQAQRRRSGLWRDIDTFDCISSVFYDHPPLLRVFTADARHRAKRASSCARWSSQYQRSVEKRKGKRAPENGREDNKNNKDRRRKDEAAGGPTYEAHLDLSLCPDGKNRQHLLGRPEGQAFPNKRAIQFDRDDENYAPGGTDGSVGYHLLASSFWSGWDGADGARRVDGPVGRNYLRYQCAPGLGTLSRPQSAPAASVRVVSP